MTDELEARRRAKAAQDTQALLDEAMAATMSLVSNAYRAAERQVTVGLIKDHQVHMFAMVHALSAQWLANKDLHARTEQLDARLKELESTALVAAQPKVTL